MITDQLRRFLQTTLGSVWALELMLALQRHERGWSAAALTAELRASLPLVTDLLERFQQAGLVAQQDGQWSWRPARPELADLARAAAEAYEQTPQQVIKLIFSAPNDRVRLFADAFKLRKDEDPH